MLWRIWTLLRSAELQFSPARGMAVPADLEIGAPAGPVPYRWCSPDAPSVLWRLSSATFSKCFGLVLGHLLGKLGREVFQLFQVPALLSDTDPCFLREE